MRKPATRSLGAGEGGEGGSFVRSLFMSPSPEAESLTPAWLLMISLALSAMLVGLVTLAISR